MKIVFLTEVYHPTVNGVVIAIDSFSAQLQKKGHQVYIIAPHNLSYEDSSDQVFRVPALPLGLKHDYFLSFPNWISFETIKMLNPDIIHTHHIWTMGRFGLKASQLLNIPLVVTYHTLMESYAHKVRFISQLPLCKPLIRSFIIRESRSFCNQADLVISPSDSMKKVIRGYGVKTKIETLATGINLKDFQFHSRPWLLKKHHIKELGSRILLFVGRLASEKNITMLLKAFVLILEQVPHCYLILLGSGPQAALYQKQVKDLGLEKQVIMPGLADPAEAKKYFGAADLFLFPSITDTQGIVILEAMAAGAVPVAVNKLGPTDIINSGYNGFLTPNDPKKFAQAAINLLKSPRLLSKLKKNGAKKARSFTIQHQTDKLITLYQKLIYEKPTNNFSPSHTQKKVGQGKKFWN